MPRDDDNSYPTSIPIPFPQNYTEATGSFLTRLELLVNAVRYGQLQVSNCKLSEAEAYSEIAAWWVIHLRELGDIEPVDPDRLI
jgi:hypothetical protein